MNEQDSARPLLIERENPLGWLILNRPQVRNALNLETWRLIADGIRDLDSDPTVRVIVMRGVTPKSFISGADISEFSSQRGDAAQAQVYRAQLDETLSTMVSCSKPIIAMISGFCMGGGVQVALACDIRIAARGTRFAVPAGRLGLAYPIDGVVSLTNIVGPANARDILYSARQFDAEEAYAMGLVNRVVDPEVLEAYVRQYAHKVSENAPLTVSAAKLTIREALKDPADRDHRQLDEAVRRCFDSEDYREGVNAFMERRQPRFAGR